MSVLIDTFRTLVKQNPPEELKQRYLQLSKTIKPNYSEAAPTGHNFSDEKVLALIEANAIKDREILQRLQSVERQMGTAPPEPTTQPNIPPPKT